MDWGEAVIAGIVILGMLLVVALGVYTAVDTGNQRECRVKAVTEQGVTADEAERICQ